MSQPYTVGEILSRASAPSSLLALFKLNNTLQELKTVMGTLTTPTPPHGRTVLLERVHQHLMEILECTPHLSPTEFVPVRFVIINVQKWLRRQLKDLTERIALTDHMQGVEVRGNVKVVPKGGEDGLFKERGIGLNDPDKRRGMLAR